MKHILIAAFTASSLATGASAVTGFTDFVGFGDSFSDKGRLPNALVAPPSLDGRFSDGPTWMERLGAAFAARGGQNVNMAVGGATAGPLNDRDPDLALAEFFNGPRDPGDPDDIPLLDLRNFSAQISAFQDRFAASVGGNPLVTVLLGGNDFLQRPDDPATPETIIGSIASGISALANSSSKFNDFMVSNLPLFTYAPNLQGDPFGTNADLDTGIIAFNLALDQQMQDLEAGLDLLGLDVTIEIFDLSTAFDAAYTQAVDAGLIADEACTDSLTSLIQFDNKCLLPGSSANYIFADNVHPNSFIHERIGAAALAQVADRIAPVPLPAGGVLLIAGLGAFAVMRRRAA